MDGACNGRDKRRPSCHESESLVLPCTAAVHGAADFHAHQRDAGGLQHAGVDAGRGGAVLWRDGHAAATAGRAAVDVWRAAGAQPGRVVAAAGFSPRARRCVHAAGHHLVGVLQLAAVAHQRARIRGDWAAFLMAQMVFGLAWSGSFAGVEWAMGHTHIAWGWPLIAALAFIAVGPAVLAYRCWGVGAERAGPAVAGFFVSLSPLFAGILSAAFLGETPQLFHGVAFALIVGGIVVSSRR